MMRRNWISLLTITCLLVVFSASVPHPCAAEEEKTTNMEAARQSYEQLRSDVRKTLDQSSEQPPQQTASSLRNLFITFENSAFRDTLSSKNKSLYKKLEGVWSQTTAHFAQQSVDQGQKSGRKLLNHFKKAGNVLDKPTTAVFLFTQSLIIIFREGVEAILILGAMIGLLAKLDQDQFRSDIYIGTGAALLLSLLIWIGSRFFFTTLENPTFREALEGLTMLLAMVVLFSVSHWLVGKAQAERWMKYMKKKIKQASSSGQRWALFGVSFLVVFREGFETVLFYESLTFQAGDVSNGYAMLGSGFLVGCVLLTIVYILVTRYGIKLPMKPFFFTTGVLLYLLAFKFAGSGVMELQEVGLVGSSTAGWIPTHPFLETWLGINGTYEAFILQSILLLCVLIGLVYHFIIIPGMENHLLDEQDQEEDPYKAHEKATRKGFTYLISVFVGLFVIGFLLVGFFSHLTGTA